MGLSPCTFFPHSGGANQQPRGPKRGSERRPGCSRSVLAAAQPGTETELAGRGQRLSWTQLWHVLNQWHRISGRQTQAYSTAGRTRMRHGEPGGGQPFISTPINHTTIPRTPPCGSPEMLFLVLRGRTPFLPATVPYFLQLINCSY